MKSPGRTPWDTQSLHSGPTGPELKDKKHSHYPATKIDDVDIIVEVSLVTVYR